MRIHLFLLLVCSTLLQADWKNQMFEKGNTLYQNTRDKTIELYHVFKPVSDTPETQQKVQINTLWEELLPQFEKGLRYTERLEEAPESSWIGRDKREVQQDINTLFDTMIDTLTEENFLSFKHEINILNKMIRNNKNTIADYREKKLSAPQESTLRTTQSDYMKKIQILQEENHTLKIRSEQIKKKLIKQFSNIGITLTEAQLNVLLTRIDGDDIIQMALMMDVLKQISKQIMVLMQENSEALAYAKKYYGLHLVMLEFIVYIQQKYIDKVNHVYLPKIDNIIFEAHAMITETKKLAASETSQRRREVYAKNREAQELTAHVAARYREDLIHTGTSIRNAQKITRKNLQLAENTYKTVILSADLYTLIAESQQMFSEVSRVQVPQIIPFENIQIEKKYYELTKMIETP